MGKARLQIWNRANTVKLADAFTLDPDLNQRNVDDLSPTGSKLNESGSGGLVLQEDHPAAEHAVAGNVVRVVSTAGADPLYAFTIAERDHVQVHKVQRDRTVTLSGDDLLERWNDSTVDPWIDGKPISIDRIWNWAAPRGFDDSSWSTAEHVQTRTVEPVWPEAYPVSPLFAAQVWTAAYADPQPVGSSLFRRKDTPAADCDVAVYHSADDAANHWQNGVLLNRNSTVWPDTSGWQKVWREVPPWTGEIEHVTAFEAFNRGGPAYFMASALTVVNGVLADPVFSTGDGGWRWLHNPSVKPGFTSPQIMQMLLDEAQARGELAGWSITVHGTHENIEEFSARVGQTYREVIAALASMYCDVAADPEGLVLHMWPKGEIGTVTSVSLEDTAIRVLQRIETDDVHNAAQGVWSDGSRRVTRAAHPTLGRKSKSFQLGSVTDPAVVDRILNAYLDAHELPVPAIVGEFRDLPGAVAGVDYKVGDTLELSGSSIVCTGITWTVGRDGELIAHPEFESSVAVRRREVMRTIDRLSSQFEAPATASILSSAPLLVSGHPSTSEWTWTWADDIEEALNEIDPEKPWQVKRTETTQRAWKFMLEIDVEDLPDAWGTTTLELWKNDAVWDVLFDVSLTTVVAKAEVLLWGYETLTPADGVRVACSVDGGHVDGTATLHLADAV